MNAARDLPRLGAVIAIGVLAFLPMARLPAFYDSFLYMVFFWVSLSTSWALLSGFAGYFSLGHAAFFGTGLYTTAVLTTKFGWPFLSTLPVAAAIAALLAVGIGAVVFRLRRLRGELFALLTLAVTFVVATIILNTPIDGGGGIFMSAVPLPHRARHRPARSTCWASCSAWRRCVIAWWVAHSRLGMGLFAIHDDEDVAEAKGVPTLRYKLIAFALSAGDRRRRGRRACDVCRLHHGVRHLRAHRAALRRADERARRRAQLVRAGDRRHRHHRAALCLHQRRRGDDRPRHRRR